LDCSDLPRTGARDAAALELALGAFFLSVADEATGASVAGFRVGSAADDCVWARGRAAGPLADKDDCAGRGGTAGELPAGRAAADTADGRTAAGSVVVDAACLGGGDLWAPPDELVFRSGDGWLASDTESAGGASAVQRTCVPQAARATARPDRFFSSVGRSPRVDADADVAGLSPTLAFSFFRRSSFLRRPAGPFR
jgi:hypothetical protein